MMRRILGLLHLVLLVPQRASALQLHWASGATDVSCAEARRCTLLLVADLPATRLPSEWRLLCTGDSLSIVFLASEASDPCLLDEAQVSQLEGPATAADSAAHQFTAHFCSADGMPASLAQQVVELPAGGHGKLKVVALDPDDPDSARVLQSNEVTYNGGIGGEYPPVVLRATSVHRSLRLTVTAIGSGLDAASTLSILAPDSSWSLPLTVTSRTDGSVTGVASVAALLPECQAAVGSASGPVTAARLPADQEPASEAPLRCSAQYFEELVQPPPPGHGYAIQPKDFAFTRGFIDASSDRYALHLFYIRQTYYNVPDDDKTKNLGHIWTTDFNSWFGPCQSTCPPPNDPCGLNCADTMAIVARPGRFDELHVWAPTIVQHGPTFWMFYTGVRNEGGKRHQRIGRATSTDLITWAQADEVVLTAPRRTPRLTRAIRTTAANSSAIRT